MIDNMRVEDIISFQKWKRNHPDQEAIRRMEDLSRDLFHALKSMERINEQ